MKKKKGVKRSFVFVSDIVPCFVEIRGDEKLLNEEQKEKDLKKTPKKLLLEAI